MALPSLTSVLLTKPLYEPVPVVRDHDGAEWIATLSTANIRFDCYCPSCGRDSVFQSARPEPGRNTNGKLVHQSVIKNWLADREFSFEASCVRNAGHKMVFSFVVRSFNLIKVGQFPSQADLANPEVSKYRKILGDERAAELHRAIGLAAHGVGVGSYVYLRRIFESLLRQHRDALVTAGKSIPDLDGLRMAEKIEALADSLPPFLVRNKALYGILSAGLHELTEADCLSRFDILKDAIVLILQQDLEKRQRVALEQKLAAEIQRAAGEIKASDPDRSN